MRKVFPARREVAYDMSQPGSAEFTRQDLDELLIKKRGQIPGHAFRHAMSLDMRVRFGDASTTAIEMGSKCITVLIQIDYYGLS
jgi:hypothetical protein